MPAKSLLVGKQNGKCEGTGARSRWESAEICVSPFTQRSYILEYNASGKTTPKQVQKNCMEEEENPEGR